MRPEPISREKREEVIVHMAAALLGAYEYFRSRRGAYGDTALRSQCFQGRAERPVPVWLREEIQAVLRRGDGELSALWLPPLLEIS